MSAIKNNEGIDIQKALAILSARKTDPSDSDDGCGCHGTRAPDDAKNLGQEIDLFGERSSRNAQEEQNVDEEKTQKERAKRKEDILNELKGMSLAELLRTLLKAQEDRVKAYNEFENGLVTVLQTGNISKYPEATLKATASFSVLSETVIAIQKILESRKSLEIARYVEVLQGHEKEKLHLTAAHHLERIRRRNESQQPNQDVRTMKLLDDGVASLQQKISTCIGNINECIDEIRCSLIDVNEP